MDKLISLDSDTIKKGLCLKTTTKYNILIVNKNLQNYLLRNNFR